MAIYVLTLRGVPVAASYRFERLNETTAEYTQEDQAHMLIREVDILT
jgi:hypothetical protein